MQVPSAASRSSTRPVAPDGSRPSAAGNKRSNLHRLSDLSDSLDYGFPETYFLPASHFLQALTAIHPISAGELNVNTLSQDAANRVRQALLSRPLPGPTIQALTGIYRAFEGEGRSIRLSVRSCYEAEDLPSRSFAGAFESVLDVNDLGTLCRAVQFVYASVFSPRALAELSSVEFDNQPAMSVAIQRMLGGAGWLGGVAHTQYPDLAPFPLMLLSVSENAAAVTSGSRIAEDYLVARSNLANPKRAVVVQAQPGSSTLDRFALTDDEVRRIATTLVHLEEAFECPLEVEWLVDPNRRLHLLQARSIDIAAVASQPACAEGRYKPLCTGLPVGIGRVTAQTRRVGSLKEALEVPPGYILIAENTDPDWVPAVRRSAGIVTAVGARTSHVSRTARESAVLAVVGCGYSIDAIPDATMVTIVCAEGLLGSVYAGRLPEDALSFSSDDLHLNSAASAFTYARSTQPDRVYLALDSTLDAYRLPPLDTEPSPRLRRRIAGYPDIRSFATQKLTESVCLVGVAFPSSEIVIKLDSASDLASLLDEVTQRCREKYGTNVSRLVD